MPTLHLATYSDIARQPGMKALRNALTDDPHDREAVSLMIEAFSAMAERITGRLFHRTTHTEVLEARQGQRSIQLRGYPVSSITSVKESATNDWANTTALDSALYSLQLAGQTGVLLLRPSAIGLLEGVQSLQIIYVGGLAEEPEHVPADLRYACIEQVVFWWRRQPTIETMGQGQAQGSVTLMQPSDLLPGVQRTLYAYRIWDVG